MAKKVGVKTRSAQIGVRISPRAKYMLDVMGRIQRRTMSGVIESALLAYAKCDEERLADQTWSTDESERLLNLYLVAPHLLSFDEEIEVKRLITAKATA
ncbi:hypothetical protein [Pseudomonas fluorescens]|uniref:hypothetical protein n=1 Tax=Pseudomonas fluorescens TaxID=294 RepID=UPI00036FA204|nr:hypothetical protein [Pseudomonas fluorescens]